MKLGELSAAEITSRLKGLGLRWQLGPFTVELKGAPPNLADQLRLIYGEHPLFREPWQEVADFHVRLLPGRGVRRWLRPQVHFYIDGPSPFAPFPRDHALPLLEWGLNFCIASRANHYLLLHTASLARGERGLILPGVPGSGKSTLAAALALSGWRLFSDEFALIRPDNGEMIPLVRPVALKNESIPAIRAYHPGVQLGPAFDKTRKGTVAHLPPPVGSVADINQPATPTWVICPRYQPDAPTTLTPLPKSQGALRIAANAFNYEILGPRAFEVVSQMAKGCRLFELSYSDLAEAVQVIEGLAAEG
ncbi:MAG: HprK-related kinase A [Magnetococcales bacterium]|nr:HprK-related kinase A [Magnetococcales bacterium]